MLEGWNVAYGSLRCPKNGTYGVSGKSGGEDCLKAGVPVEMGHWLLQGEVRLHEAAAVEPLKARMLERARTGWRWFTCSVSPAISGFL